ncbi:MAG TPA: carboxypeptidase-like regulatory domain-containing protein [Chryseosolibacter sp.]
MKQYLLTLILFTAAVTAFAQQSVNGVIRDDVGNPVPGATVGVKGTNNFTITDANGAYTLSASQKLPFTLTVSFLGFKSQEVQVFEVDAEPLEISLQQDNVLKEVVVVGYGVQEKERCWLDC